MNFSHLAISLALMGLVLWLSQKIPLAGARKAIAVGARLLAIAMVCAALWAFPRRWSHEAPRQILYLVDQSASIDPRQRAWIARRLASLEAIRPSRLSRAVMAFGRDTASVADWGTEALTDPSVIERLLRQASVGDDRTDLEGALLSALAASSTPGRTSLVLFSDGHETMGSTAMVVAALRGRGLSVFPVTVPVFNETKTVWDDLLVPPSVQRGGAIPVRLVIFNAAQTMKDGQAAIALQGITVKQQAMRLRSGWQVATVTVPAIQRGTMALTVHLRIPSDGVDEQRQAYTEIEGPPQLILVTEHPSAPSPLAAVLKQRQMDVSVMRPADLSADRLRNADAVLLDNLPKSALSPAQVDELRRSVELGGGLLMVGLGGDLAHEIATASPLDELLPVRFDPKGLREAKRRICVILLIDRSQSMFGPRIAATKRAAVALIKQLSPEDLVGMLAFDTKPYVVAEVQPAGGVTASLVDTLVKLRATGGTDVYPALAAAATRLEATGATIKHIILLSDGNTPFAELRQSYATMLQAFQKERITISTIGIGSAFINTDYLQYLSRSTGGRFYQMNSLEELPHLLARDTQQMLDRLPFAEGNFRPQRAPSSDWFAEVPEWPALRGYLTATAKPEARVDLTINGGEGDLSPEALAKGDDPLLARWMRGKGRVVSFLSDAHSRWSPEWVRWPGYEATWAHIARWAMRPRMSEELFTWVDDTGSAPHLVIEGALTDPKARLLAGDGSGEIPLPLVQHGAWRWQASLEQVPGGWHQLRLDSTIASPEAAAEQRQISVETKRWIRVGAPTAEGEITGQPPEERLLRSLSGGTHGVYNAPDRAFVPLTAPVTTTAPMFHWWLPLAIVALLVDIALRGGTML
ncbi:MAG: VWA domain-containing protein [Candidatus Omnitrophica bacterium]|nr:VWA domain-containing protein [Candidatus Omnitrophota bacterium]